MQDVKSPAACFANHFREHLRIILIVHHSWTQPSTPSYLQYMWGFTASPLDSRPALHGSGEPLAVHGQTA